jgi:hypothetical protein
MFKRKQLSHSLMSVLSPIGIVIENRNPKAFFGTCIRFTAYGTFAGLCSGFEGEESRDQSRTSETQFAYPPAG